MSSDIEQHLRSGHYARDLRWLNWPCTVGACQQAVDRGGYAYLMAHLSEAFHSKRGVQMRVTKEVSDDMLLTDMGNVGFHEVPWVAPSVEVFWEDPTLPTILLARANRLELESTVRGRLNHLIPLPVERVMVRMDCQSPDGQKVLTEVLKEDTWEAAFIRGEQTEALQGSLPINPQEARALRFMMGLAFKVFAYASLPRYAPEKVVAPITRAMGGKPGYMGRPMRPALRIIYLPSVHTVVKHEEGSNGGPYIGRSFNGRRGHFRTYRHERYQTMRGVRQFIAPIRVSGAPEVTYMVRQPPAAVQDRVNPL